MPGWTSFFGRMVAGWLSSGVGGAAAMVIEHFSAHGDVVERVLRESHEQAWLSIETALAGPSIIQRIGGTLQSPDQKRLAEAVGEFTAEHFRDQPDAACGRCLASLRRARQQGLLEVQAGGASLWPRSEQEVSAHSEEDVSNDSLIPLGEEHRELVALVAAPQPSGRPLLMELCRSFFLLKVQQDEVLVRTLEFVQWEQVPGRFAALHDALQTIGGSLEVELRGQRQLLHDMHAKIDRLMSQGRLPRGELEPHHSISFHTEREKRLVRQLLAQFRNLPEDQQRRMLDVERDLGELLFGCGLPEQAGPVFHDVAAREDRSGEQSLAHYNAYRAALERQDWETALEDLLHAAKGDKDRFAPFPLDRYEPLQILGAGGFGVVFLCQDHFVGGKQVVIKSLRAADMARKAEEVFHELTVLGELRNPRILVPYECGFADAGRRRPYLKMDYFPGQTLQAFVRDRRKFPAEAWRKVALAMARTMHAAHEKKVLHRDLKPDNVLVLIQGTKLEFKIIDFGLALPLAPLERSIRHGTTESLIGSTAVGTLKYAPPEQRGERTDVRPGPYSDIYSFGKLSCYALFGTTEPRRRHWRELEDDALADLLEDCLEEEPEERPQSFADVAARLLEVPSRSAPPPRKKSPRTAVPASEPAPPPVAESPAAARIDGTRPGEEWSDNSLNMPFRWCPPGKFLMGSPVNEEGRDDDEDQVQVTLTRGFWLGKYTVTQAEWQQVMGSKPWKRKEWVKEDPRCPATYVSWEDAMEFCRKLTERERQAGRLPEGWEYTLPSEAQWEYACRAGTTTAYHFGDDASLLRDYAWFDDNAYDIGEKYAHEVGQKKPNARGLHDMHGNVWEWCQDVYQEKLPGGTNPVVDDGGSGRVDRGGSWLSHPGHCRSAARLSGSPENRRSYLGFRLARVPQAE